MTASPALTNLAWLSLKGSPARFQLAAVLGWHSGSPVASLTCGAMCLLRAPAARVLVRHSHNLPEAVARDGVEHVWPAYRDALDALLRDNPLLAAIEHPTFPTTVVVGDADPETPAEDVLVWPTNISTSSSLPPATPCCRCVMPIRWCRRSGARGQSRCDSGTFTTHRSRGATLECDHTPGGVADIQPRGASRETEANSLCRDRSHRTRSERRLRRGCLVNRLKTVRGHLDGVIRMVEEDADCIEVMKQLSALQSSLERSNRLVLLNHLETCFSGAVSSGRGAEALAEFMDALKFHDGLTGPGIAAALAEESSPLLSAPTFTAGGDGR